MVGVGLAVLVGDDCVGVRDGSTKPLPGPEAAATVGAAGSRRSKLSGDGVHALTSNTEASNATKAQLLAIRNTPRTAGANTLRSRRSSNDYRYLP